MAYLTARCFFPFRSRSQQCAPFVIGMDGEPPDVRSQHSRGEEAQQIHFELRYANEETLLDLTPMVSFS